ncbi:shikimate kinase [Fervidobacterium thailandense]|uniref:Shikimate kinase n=1 Tax=Fervidobacterium thailandense TaxID=1008305 RepID=A0A1E3G2X7_9BACT|nr:shikimate kinase [Fervidobacterium thailandense]ODN30018.1 hypothetical protein A4H02_07515 [Fervidobacterium thailandense]
MLKFAVVGSPIYHSKSPLIFAKFGSRLGVSCSYTRLRVSSFEEALELSEHLRIDGINITAPFKEDAFRVCKARGWGVSETALLSGAVNTVAFRRSTEMGCANPFCTNTDVLAIEKFLRRYIGTGSSECVKTALLGAGGAARAVLAAMTLYGQDTGTKFDVTVFNRTVGKASLLAKKFAGDHVTVSTAKLEEFPTRLETFELILNCLSVRPEELRKLELGKNAVFIDANYRERVEVTGGVYVPGETWLLAQGLEAFRIFTEKDIDPNIWDEIFDNSWEHVLKNSRSKKPVVFLIGLSGTGKTTVGRLLAAVTDAEHVDTDVLIEERTGMSVSEIFEKLTETRFRELETVVLSDVLRKDGAQIVSTGGGIVLKAENRQQLTEGHVIWLWAGPDECASRLAGTTDRPLLKADGVEETVCKLKVMLNERLDLYFSVADLVVPTEGRTPEEIVQILSEELETYVIG